MKTVSVRDLRNKGGNVLEEVLKGQSFVVTRDGIPVAELSQVRQRSPRPEELIRRRQTLPTVDPATMKHDIDEVLDPTL